MASPFSDGIALYVMYFQFYGWHRVFT